MSIQAASPPASVLSISRCRRCQGAARVQRITPSRTGYEHWMLRCTRCGHIAEMQVSCSPSPEPLEWFDNEFSSPE